MRFVLQANTFQRLRGRKSMRKSIFPQANTTPKIRGTRHLLKEQLKAKASSIVSFFPHFSFLQRSVPSSRSWILKDDTVNKGRLQPEMRFFFLRNNYFEVPTNAGGVSYGRTGRTLERAGSGSHLDAEERTVRAPRSLVMALPEKSISLDRVTR